MRNLRHTRTFALTALLQTFISIFSSSGQQKDVVTLRPFSPSEMRLPRYTLFAETAVQGNDISYKTRSFSSTELKGTMLQTFVGVSFNVFDIPSIRVNCGSKFGLLRSFHKHESQLQDNMTSTITSTYFSAAIFLYIDRAHSILFPKIGIEYQPRYLLRSLFDTNGDRRLAGLNSDCMRMLYHSIIIYYRAPFTKHIAVDTFHALDICSPLDFKTMEFYQGQQVISKETKIHIGIRIVINLWGTY